MRDISGRVKAKTKKAETKLRQSKDKSHQEKKRGGSGKENRRPDKPGKVYPLGQRDSKKTQSHINT